MNLKRVAIYRAQVTTRVVAQRRELQRDALARATLVRPLEQGNRKGLPPQYKAEVHAYELCLQVATKVLNMQLLE